MRRAGWLVAVFAVVAGAFIVWTAREDAPARSEYCVAKVGQVRAEIDLEQAQWSALMAAVATRRGLPPRATTIAIATAFQESKIHNIDYGDRDSLGLFQQRPSQGWGTREQLLDPLYAIGAFYDALAKIDGYTGLEITVAAQKVQRSAFPGAYAQHEDYARAMASSLMGYSPAAFWCQVTPRDGGTVDAVDDLVRTSFGPIDVERHQKSVTYPVGGAPAAREQKGWRLAQFLVANAAKLRLEKVSFDGRTWTAQDSPDGWVADDDAPATGRVVAHV